MSSGENICAAKPPKYLRMAAEGSSGGEAKGGVKIEDRELFKSQFRKQ